MKVRPRLILLSLFALITVEFLSSPTCAEELQYPSSQGALTQNNDPNETILKFESFLRSEAKDHRDFLESYYAKVAGAFAFIGVIFGGLLTWLNWKSKDDIRKQVNEQFKQSVETIIADKITQVDILLKESRDKSDHQVKEINKLLLELSKRTETTTISETINDAQSLVGKKILWVDDHPKNNDYPMQILGEAGVKFQIALSTEEALRYVKEEKFDLIISDMGRGSDYTAGLKLLEEIKILSVKIPVIIYASGRALLVNGQRALNLGAISTVSGVTQILNEVQRYFLNK